MQYCKHSSVAIVWDQETYVSNGQGALWEQQAPYGFKTGVGVTLHLPGGEHFLPSTETAPSSRASKH
jgi:hypothetical protein